MRFFVHEDDFLIIYSILSNPNAQRTMPIYMDLHIVPGVIAEHVAQAHQEDLKIQRNYGCSVMTYWVDQDHGSAFCLLEAPNKSR